MPVEFIARVTCDWCGAKAEGPLQAIHNGLSRHHLPNGFWEMSDGKVMCGGECRDRWSRNAIAEGDAERERWLRNR